MLYWIPLHTYDALDSLDDHLNSWENLANIMSILVKKNFKKLSLSQHLIELHNIDKFARNFATVIRNITTIHNRFNSNYYRVVLLEIVKQTKLIET